MSMKRIIVLSVIFCIAAPMTLIAQGQKTVDPLNWRDLAPYIPKNIPGWKEIGELEGHSMSVGVKLSQVMQAYTSGKRNLKIQIVDSGGNPMILAPLKMVLQTEIDTNNEYIRKFEVEGQPGAVKYEFKKKIGEIIVLVAVRFYIQITVENIEEKAVADLKTITKLIDIAGLTNLVKK